MALRILKTELYSGINLINRINSYDEEFETKVIRLTSIIYIIKPYGEKVIL